MNEGRTTDGTVGKALDVLDLVADFGRPVRFSEVLARSEYPKATLYRLLQTLTRQRLLAFDPDTGVYAIGVRLVKLAHAAWQQASLAPVARPHIDRLAAQVGETIHLAQLDNGQVLYIDKRNAKQPVEMFSQAGRIGPAYCTGVGKAMMAWLPEDELSKTISQQSFHRFTDHTIMDAEALRRELREIRLRGHGHDREEHEPGIICIAMPVLSEAGRVLGGVSVTTTTARKTLSDLDAIAPLLRATVEAISEEAQAWRFPDEARRNTEISGTG